MHMWEVVVLLAPRCGNDWAQLDQLLIVVLHLAIHSFLNVVWSFLLLLFWQIELWVRLKTPSSSWEWIGYLSGHSLNCYAVLVVEWIFIHALLNVIAFNNMSFLELISLKLYLVF